MSVFTFPDGSTLTSTALTPKQVETIFQTVTAQMLGIVISPWQVVGLLTNNGFIVTVPSLSNVYEGESVSGTGIPDNTTVSGIDELNSTVTLSNPATVSGNQTLSFIDPNAYFKVRVGWQIEGQPGPRIDLDTVTIMAETNDSEYSRMHDISRDPSSGDYITTTDVYTRQWKIRWIFYGSNSTDNARQIRSSLVIIQFIADYLSDYKIYVNPDIEVPRRLPENFQGRWWERVDLEVYFNEQVTETFTVGTVKSVEVEVYTKDGLQSDFTVTTP